MVGRTRGIKRVGPLELIKSLEGRLRALYVRVNDQQEQIQSLQSLMVETRTRAVVRLSDVMTAKLFEQLDKRAKRGRVLLGRDEWSVFGNTYRNAQSKLGNRYRRMYRRHNVQTIWISETEQLKVTVDLVGVKELRAQDVHE